MPRKATKPGGADAGIAPAVQMPAPKGPAAGQRPAAGRVYQARGQGTPAQAKVRAATLAFQRRAGATADGIVRLRLKPAAVGRRRWQALFPAFAGRCEGLRGERSLPGLAQRAEVSTSSRSWS